MNPICRACPRAALCVTSSAGLRRSDQQYEWPCWYVCMKCNSISWLRMDVSLELDEWGASHAKCLSLLPSHIRPEILCGRINHCMGCWRPKVTKTFQSIYAMGMTGRGQQQQIAGPTHIDPGTFLLMPGRGPIPYMKLTVMTDVDKKRVAIITMDTNNLITSELEELLR